MVTWGGVAARVVAPFAALAVLASAQGVPGECLDDIDCEWQLCHTRHVLLLCKVADV